MIMHKPAQVFFWGCFFVFILGSALPAQDINQLTDGFYNGLADIIERNIDNPQECVAEVDNYYQTHQDEVKQIRQQAEKAMEQIAPQIDKYMSMTEEEAAALAAQQKGSESTPESRMSQAAKRYSEAVKAFSAKYPKEGMEIAGKAMQLFMGPGKE